MFLHKLLNEGNAPLLEQWVRFGAARHRLIVGDMANLDTPGYRQKDLSVGKFYSALRERAEARHSSPPGSVGFDDVTGQLDLEHPESNILFHDGNNRSMEQLATDLAKNGMMHNLAIELLRKQYLQMEMALKERVT
jgi:flagellar basal-body rod protein FlgB